MLRQFTMILLLSLVPCLSIAQGQSDSAVTTTLDDEMMDSASAPGRWDAFVSGGLMYPLEPTIFEKYHRPSGYNIGAGAGYSFAPGEIGYGTVYGHFQYNRVNFSKQGFLESAGLPANYYDSIQSSAATLSALTANFKGTFSTTQQSIAPYFTIGIGFLRYDSPEVTVGTDSTLTVPETTESVFTWNVGLGVDVPVMENISLFAEGRFALAVTSEQGTQFLPLSAGVRFRL